MDKINRISDFNRSKADRAHKSNETATGSFTYIISFSRKPPNEMPFAVNSRGYQHRYMYSILRSTLYSIDFSSNSMSDVVKVVKERLLIYGGYNTQTG